MCFAETRKWWRPGNVLRSTCHEGLDFFSYLDRDGARFLLDEESRIPLIYDGHLAEIFPDFLGQSLLVRHGIYVDDRQLCSIAAHILPDTKRMVGTVLRSGVSLGCCAPAKTVPCHFHLSLLWLSASEKAVNWSALLEHHAADFVDPLEYI